MSLQQKLCLFSLFKTPISFANKLKTTIIPTFVPKDQNAINIKKIASNICSCK